MEPKWQRSRIEHDPAAATADAHLEIVRFSDDLKIP